LNWIVLVERCLLDEVGQVILKNVRLDAQGIVGDEQVVVAEIDADLLGFADLRLQSEIWHQNKRRRLRMRATDEDLG